MTNDQWMVVFNYSYHYQAGQKRCCGEDRDGDLAIDDTENNKQRILYSGFH